MGLLQRKIKELAPSYFALVMATGIISIGAYLLEMLVLGKLLFFLNIFYFIALAVPFSIRCFRYWNLVKADFKNYQKGPGYFTLIAALCILGNQMVVFYGAMEWAKIFLAIAGILWLVLGYGYFFHVTTTQAKQPLDEGINGTWLVFIVAIQALSVLISFISDDFGEDAYLLLFLALCLFLLGCIFYLYFMSLIIYRISFFTLNASELGAPYWINMGATAITTLAGSMLIMHKGDYNFIVEILPFLKGFTLFFWASGTWWIPLLLVLGFWRHVIKKVPTPISPKGYEPSYWGMAFPLGMYTVCSFRLSEALQIEFLKGIPEVFIYIALFAWVAITIGFIRQIILTIVQREA